MTVRYQRDRIFEGDEFNGTYIVYGGTPVGSTPFACDVEIHSLEESKDDELRAHRLRQKRQGKPVRALRKDALHDELFVVFGPEMSPSEAVETLRFLAAEIERDGLLIGRRKNGDFEVEKLDGSIVR